MDMYNRVEGTGPLSARVATGFEAERENGRRVLTESVLQGISARCSRRPRSVLSPSSPSPPPKSSKTALGGGHVGRRMTEASNRARTPAMEGNASPNIHTIVKAQIVFLLSTLTEENFDRNQVEIRSVSTPPLPPSRRAADFIQFPAFYAHAAVGAAWNRHLPPLHPPPHRPLPQPPHLYRLPRRI